jgi:hypothetical protein
MAIGNRGIGWSQEENLLWEISRQLDRLNSQMCVGDCPTTTTTSSSTTTTTTTIPPNRFISTWDTRNLSAGSSNNDQITLPLSGLTSYNMTVYWGDGSSQLVTTGVFPITHTYATPGIYEIIMDINPIEKLRGFAFNNIGDILKILNISKWGAMSPFSSSVGFLYGCSNVTITATDILDLSSTTSMESYFRNCTSIVDIPNIGSWDLSNITVLQFTFFGATSFNADIRNWDVSNVLLFTSTLRNCPAFSYSIGDWNVSKAISMSSLLRDKTPLTYSTANMDDIYNKWSLLTFVNTGIVANFGTAKYTIAGAAGRAILTSPPNNWSIADGGL